MKFGEAMHSGFCHCYDNNIDRAMEAFDTIWLPFGMEDPKRNRSRAMAMYQDFQRTMAHDRAIYKIISPIGVDIEDKVSKDEVAFAIDLGMSVPFVGRIDALGEHRGTKEWWGVEYKTSSELSDRFLSGFGLSPQILSYTLALSTYTNNTVRGTIIVGLQVAKVKVNTCVNPIYVEPQALEDIAEWIRYQDRKIKVCEKAGKWPKELAACNPYSMFGQPGYTCEYQILCKQDNDDWTRLMEMFDVAPERPFVIKGETNSDK